MGGVKQPIIMNSAEKLVPTRKIIPNYAGPDKMSILNPMQQKVMGFGGGFIPKVKKLGDGVGLYTENNSFLKILKEKDGYLIDGIESQKRGDARKLFEYLASKAKQKKISIKSGDFARQQSGLDFASDPLSITAKKEDILKKIYPQLRYREGLGNTSGRFSIPGSWFRNKEFSSLDDLYSQLNDLSPGQTSQIRFKEVITNFDKGFVPNYANPLSIFKTLKNASPAISALAKKALPMLPGLISGKIDKSKIVDTFSGFIGSPSSFIKTQEDLTNVSDIFNSLMSIKKVRESVATIGATNIDTFGLDIGSALTSLGSYGKGIRQTSRAGTEGYLKYRLLGGSEKSPSDFGSSLIKRKKDETMSFDNNSDAVNGIQMSLSRIRDSGGAVFPEKKISESLYLGNEYTMGRFVAKINKAKNKGVYEDTWDIALHNDERQILNDLLSSKRKSSDGHSLNSIETGAGYNRDVESLILREIVSRNPFSNPVKLKGAVDFSSGYIPNYAKQIKLSSGTIIDSSKKYLYGDEGLIGSNKSEANYFGYEPLSFQDLKELQKKKNIPNLKVYDPSLMLKTRMDEGLFKNNLLNKLFVTGARDFKFDKLQETRLARFPQKSDSLDNLFGGLKFNKENLPAIIKNIEGKIGSEFFVKGVKGYGGNATITADMLAALFNKDYFKKIFTLDNGKFSEFGQQLTKIKRGLATNPSQFFAQEKIKGSGDEYRVTVAGTKEGGKLISSFDRRTLNRDEDAYEFSSGSSRGVSLLKNKGAQSATMRALNAVRRIPRKFREGRIFGLDALSGGVIELNASEMGAAYPGSLDNTRTSALSANTLSEISNKDVDRYTKTGLNILNYQGNESSRQKYFSSFNKTLENLKKYDEIGYYKIASNLAKSGFGINTGKKTLFGGKASKFLARKGFSDGFVPNFSNPILSAMARENAAGVPMNMMKLESSPLLKSSFNPSGLAVTNRRDEPGGISQGIARAKREGINPKSYGIPNFVSPSSLAQITQNNADERIRESYRQKVAYGSQGGLDPLERHLARNDIRQEILNRKGITVSGYNTMQRRVNDPNFPASSLARRNPRYLQMAKDMIAGIERGVEQGLAGLTKTSTDVFLAAQRQAATQAKNVKIDYFRSIMPDLESHLNKSITGFGVGKRADSFLTSKGVNPKALSMQEKQMLAQAKGQFRQQRGARLQGAAMGAAFIAPMMAGGMEAAFGSNPVTRGVGGVIQGASTGAILGSGFGVPGMAIGAGVGAVGGGALSVVNEPKVKQEERLQRFIEKQKKQGEQFDIASGIGAQTSNIKDLISSNASPALIRKNQQDLFRLQKEVKDPRISKAVSKLQTGEYTSDEYTEKIAKIQEERSNNATLVGIEESRRSASLQGMGSAFNVRNKMLNRAKDFFSPNSDWEFKDAPTSFESLGGDKVIGGQAIDISNVLAKNFSKNQVSSITGQENSRDLITSLLMNAKATGKIKPETYSKLETGLTNIDDKAADAFAKAFREALPDAKELSESQKIVETVNTSFANLNRTLNESAVRANALNSVSDNRKNIANRSSIFDQRASLDLRKYGLSESQILDSESGIAGQEIAFNRDSALTELSRGAQGSLGSLRSGDMVGGLSTGIKDEVINLLSSAETANDPAKIIENIKAVQDKLNSDTGNPNEGLKEQLRNILIPLSADVTKINDNAKEQLTELEESVKQQKKMIDLNKNLSRFGGREGFISGNRFDKDTFKKNLPGYFDAFSFQPNKNGELQTRDFNRNQGNVGKDAAIAQNRQKLIDSGRSTAGLIQQLSDSGAMTESFQEFINKKGNEGLKNVTVQANEQDILNQYRDIGKAGYEQTGLNQFAPELGAKINQQLGNLNSKTGYDGIIKTIESFNATSSGSKDAKKAALDLFKSLNPTVKKSKEAAEKQLGVLSPEKANIKFQGDVISNFDTMIKVAETIANNTSMLDSLREKGKNDAVIYNATKESGAITAKINETNASITAKQEEAKSLTGGAKTKKEEEITKLQNDLKTLETDKKTQDGKVRDAVEAGKGIDEKIKNGSAIPTVAPVGTPVVTTSSVSGATTPIPITPSAPTSVTSSGLSTNQQSLINTINENAGYKVSFDPNSLTKPTPIPNVSNTKGSTYEQMAGFQPYNTESISRSRLDKISGGNAVYDNGQIKDLRTDYGTGYQESNPLISQQRMSELSGEKPYRQDLNLSPDKYYQMAGGGQEQLKLNGGQKEQDDANKLAFENQTKVLEELKTILAGDKSSKEAQASQVGSNANIVINMAAGASAPEVAEEIKNILTNLQYKVANIEEKTGTKTPPLSLTSKSPSLG
jgi:hypothetical protein